MLPALDPPFGHRPAASPSRRSRRRRSTSGRLARYSLLAACLIPGPAPAQSLPDTFADGRARELVEAVLDAAPPETPTGSVRVSGRSRVRFLIPGQWNWRVRALLHRETVAETRFAADGTARDSLLLRASVSPVIGPQLRDRTPLWGRIGFDPEVVDPPLLGVFALGLGTVAPDAVAGPEYGFIQLLDTVFADPLGPAGPGVYRYGSSRVEEGDGYHRVDFRTRDGAPLQLEGIIWFHATTGAPIRAMMRPRGDWELTTSVRGLVRRLPLIPENASGEIDLLEVEYGPAAGGGYRPTLVRMDGVILTLWGQVLLPLKGEWALDWTVPEGAPPVLPDPVPPGWTFSQDNRARRPFVRELDQLVGPPPAPGLGELISGTLASVRFNQVQGVNFRATYPIPVGARTVLEPRLEIPTSSFGWTGSLELRRIHHPVSYGVEGYSTLRDVDPQEIVNGALASVGAILTGYDDGNYYLARGARVWLRYGELPASGGLGLFVERHEEAQRRVSYSLFEPDTSLVPLDIPVEVGTYFGIRGQGQLQYGEDPHEGLVVLRLFGQAAAGERGFVTIATTSDLVGPLPGPFTGALRLQAGISGGSVPGQALFYLGGNRTIRGYPAGIASGPSTVIATGEIGTEIPLVRLLAFGEVGWANSASRLFDDDALVTVGGGLSFGDGILRIDVGRGLSAGGVWRLHVGTSGLF